MRWLEPFLLGLALSLDALAVSVGASLAVGRPSAREIVRIAGTFALFQAAMPLLGAALGAGVAPFVAGAAPHVAGIVLVGLGGLTVRGALRREPDDKQASRMDTRTLIVLAVATSIDALAVGLSFSLSNAPLWESAAIIGAVTFLTCVAGMRMAAAAERWLGARAEIAGGVVLVLLGLRIIAEAMV